MVEVGTNADKIEPWLGSKCALSPALLPMRIRHGAKAHHRRPIRSRRQYEEAEGEKLAREAVEAQRQSPLALAALRSSIAR
jgi:hypothetical protein